MVTRVMNCQEKTALKAARGQEPSRDYGRFGFRHYPLLHHSNHIISNLTRGRQDTNRRSGVY